MSLKSLVTVIGCSAMVGLLIGCAKVPQAEVEAAKAALSQAKAAEADVYVAAQYTAAQDSLNAAIAAIEKQKSAFALSRTYEPAKATLKAVTTLAVQAQNSAASAKELAKNEAAKAIADAQAAVTNAKDLLKKAPKGKAGKATLDSLNAQISSVETSLTEANTNLTNGQYTAAKDSALAAKQKADGIAQEVIAASEKTKSTKGGKKK